MLEEEKIVHDLLSWRPEGIILCGTEHTAKTMDMLKRTNIKVVEIMDTDTHPIQSAFGFSNYKAGQETAKQLLAKGYKRFAFVGVNAEGNVRAKNRYNAFTDVIHEHGLHWLFEEKTSNEQAFLSGKHYMEKIMASDKNIECIYCSNDDLAVGAYLYCIAHNIRVPEDIAIVGFNNLAIAHALPKRLTTIDTPRYEIGKQAAAHIISETREPVIKDLGFNIITGETS